MKTLHNLRLLTATVIIALFAGCAGITEANLSETAPDAPAVSVESTVQAEEAPGYFHGGDQEEMIDVGPSNDYRNRELTAQPFKQFLN
ncbi:MAG: hypothetical protein U5K72_14270 [Balneolaceae bacterium]|nr:hypothetical protein [Balneolaceae bacterium]